MNALFDIARLLLLMADKKRDRPSWIRYSGIGIEFAAAVAVFTLVGYWIGRHYGSAQLGLLIGAALGLIGGMYNLIRESLAAFRPTEPPDQEGDEAPPRQQ